MDGKVWAGIFIIGTLFFGKWCWDIGTADRERLKTGAIPVLSQETPAAVEPATPVFISLPEAGEGTIPEVDPVSGAEIQEALSEIDPSEMGCGEPMTIDLPSGGTIDVEPAGC